MKRLKGRRAFLIIIVVLALFSMYSLYKEVHEVVVEKRATSLVSEKLKTGGKIPFAKKGTQGKTAYRQGRQGGNPFPFYKFESQIPRLKGESENDSIGNISYQFYTHNPKYDRFVSRDAHRDKSPFCHKDLVDLIIKCAKDYGSECVFVDVGANIGSCSVLAALYGAEVHAFEPVHDNQELIKINTVANNLTDRLTLYPFSASDFEEESVIFIDTTNFGHSRIGSDSNWTDPNQMEKQIVRSFRIDSVAGLQKRINLLKLDVQGHEWRAINGSLGIFDKFGVDLVHFEFSPCMLNTEEEPYMAFRFLRYLKDDLGWKLYRGGGISEENIVSDQWIKEMSNPTYYLFEANLIGVPPAKRK